jgi:copper chaperone CopZ
MKTILRVEGMSCDHCVQYVKKALESVAGVKSAEVSLGEKSAAVEHGDGVSLAALKTAVAEEGYEATSG